MQFKIDLDVAGIQYMGESGISSTCKESIIRLIQFNDKILQTRVLSCSNKHALLLRDGAGDLIAIKSGFSSGYGGEGPHALSYVLQLLNFHGSKINEFIVDKDILERLNSSALTSDDIVEIDNLKCLTPTRWHEYIVDRDMALEKSGRVWIEFPPVIPYSIIDRRIADLAVSYWDNPDDKLMTGYRRLEDILRKRSGVDEHGTKLFSQALKKLDWENCGDAEKAGRINLFTGVYMAFRNPRAHKELQDDPNDKLREFLLLNQLYELESSLIDTEKELEFQGVPEASSNLK
jgi:hypothetical protein